jgi:asparagine synthase (glutamine-hydrolysing)
MCGLAGIVVGPSSRVDAADLRRMGAAIRHRGPDDQGYLLWSPTEQARTGHKPESGGGRVGFVHRRLSILDLSEHGWQPMASADRRYHLVYNGEIYNYVELRRELEALGRHLVSHGDTEVLLEAVIEWGIDEAMRRCEGMYAFALLDTATATLTLARDPFGIKPLYYLEQDERFAFASEIKALLTVEGFARRVNPRAMLAYLTQGLCDHTTDSMFANIHQLHPAGILVVDVAGIPRIVSRRTGWVPCVMATLDVSPNEAASLVREAFVGNISRHLRSDVPVGAALSGGVDSSSIVSVMRRVAPTTELHAFSYFADDSRLNEERWVHAAAGSAGALVHAVRVDAETLARDVDTLIRAQDEPFDGTSIYAQFSVFRAVAEAGIRVVLDGQGADELLGGYAAYLGPHIANLVTLGHWRAAAQLVRTSHGRADVSVMSAARYLIGASTPRWMKERLSSRVRAAMLPTWIDAEWFMSRGGTPVGHQQDPGPGLRSHLVQSIRTTLPSLLRYEDRNSMAFSVESRVPFLTTRFAELVLALPDSYLIAPDGTRKAVFRNAMRGIVPDVILDRRDKLGFHTPEQSLLGAAHAWASRVLNSETGRQLPGVTPTGISRAATMVGNGLHGPTMPVWRILNLIRWAELFDVQFV